MDPNVALNGCVSSLRTSMSLLDSSISILDSGVSDYPRLTRVLQTTRHFELISSHDLTTAQSTLLSEIRPEIDGLLGRVEAYLERLKRREGALIAKAELQEGRLSRSSGGEQRGNRTPGKVGADGAGSLSKLEEAKLGQLRLKKERLSYAVSRLELQAGQRQRQLRKSMAAQ
ncbi:hypothetical protein LTR62_004633 [Meristemomyces frigidus]|uniref:DASH complex subunit SPC19 n=1 Tax=Meristemomyces frigidus TaxID=1508187 RepID=A0AAN7TGN5_9PEZI|nr:hypothetical protein LTR62_004633 [Meristemomyces frigidus]